MRCIGRVLPILLQGRYRVVHADCRDGSGGDDGDRDRRGKRASGTGWTVRGGVAHAGPLNRNRNNFPRHLM